MRPQNSYFKPRTRRTTLYRTVIGGVVAILLLALIPYVGQELGTVRRVEAAVTMTVTTTADTVAADGQCSLREALQANNTNLTVQECIHNGTGGLDTINFNIAGAGPHEITLTNDLPLITQPVLIDGWSEPSFSTTPVVVLNGIGVVGTDVLDANGLTLFSGSGGSTIRGLVIQNFDNSGIRIQDSFNNTIVGNYIGTNAAGTAAAPNEGLFDGAGIEIVTASNNNIGGPNGLLVGNNCTGDCNLVSGNGPTSGYVGIKIRDDAENNLVQGNFIGSDRTGTLEIGNGRIGLQIINSDNNTIGGTTIAQRNVISGNEETGLVIISYGSGGLEGTGNVVRNNYVGLNSAGTAAIAVDPIDWSGEPWNYQDGMRIRNSPSNTITGNYVAGNFGTAIRLQSYGFLLATSGSINTDNVTVTNNFIGTNGSGTGSIPNGEFGIFMQGASNNLIQGNVVNNNNRGIVVDHEYYDVLAPPVEFVPSLNNRILLNLVANNVNLGIDIVQRPVQSVPTFGITANDVNDPDGGNNDQQNFPVLTAANLVAGPSLTVNGNLNSLAGTYRVEFFSSPSCDSSGNGEGATFLGFTTVNIAAPGTQVFSATGLPTVTVGNVVTATATSANGGAGGETSEFSGCATVTSALPTVSISDPTVVEGTGGGPTVMTYNVTLSAASGSPVSVPFSVTGASTANNPADYSVVTGSPLNFIAGDTFETITINVVTDALDEANETVVIQLGSPSGANLDPNPANTEGIGTINDDDNPPTVSIDDPIIVEGTGAGTTTLTYNVTLSGPSGLNIQVPFSVTGGTANNPLDYTVATGSPLIFAPGDTSEVINITVVRDTIDELDETIVITLGVPTNATINDGSGTGTITDDDDPPTVSIADDTDTEGTGAGTTNLTFDVTLSSASSFTVTVPFTVVDGSATNPADYTVVTASPLTFNPGVTTQTITISVVRDALDEPNENFTINLGVPTNATINDGTATGTINDDDAAPTVSVTDDADTEGTGAGTTTLTFDVTLSAASGQTVTVPFTVVEVTALDPEDYTVVTASPLTFNPGVTTQTITVEIVRDALDEINETFNVTLGVPTNATIADGTGVGTINDDDAAPTVSITDDTDLEGTGAGTTTLTFDVTLSAASGQTVTVPFTAANVTATGADYAVVTASPLTFTPGVTTQTITVNIVRDAIDEDDETFNITLGVPTNATIADGTGVGTITDDDDAPDVNISDDTDVEGTGAGTTNLTFTVSLTNVSGRTVTVPFTVVEGTALEPEDYTVVTASPLTFNPGTVSQIITVSVVRDAIDENNETFAVNLGVPTNATINDGNATGTINDDDNAPVVSIDDVTVSEAAGTLTFTVSLSNPSSQTVTVPFVAANVTATTPADYTVVTASPLTFVAGDVSETITVNIADDLLDEADETFTVTLGAPTNATLDPTPANTIGVGTITDNDAAPTVSINDVAVNEGTGGGPTVLTFTVSLSAASGQTVTVPFTSAPNTAITPADYSVVTVSPLTFNPGVTTQSITVNVVTDAIDENNEDFSVTLQAPTNATLDPTPANTIGVGTINDDDNAPTVSIADAAVTEGTGAGTTTLSFTVTLSNQSSFSVTVPFSVVDGSATNPADYTVTTVSPLTFNPGVVSQTIELDIVRDASDEPNENLTVNLGVPTNATILDGTAIGTINDDDGEPLVSIDDVAVNENAGTLTFTVSLSNASGQTVTVPFVATDVTATGADYGVVTVPPLTFIAGDISESITVNIVNDLLDENNETFTVTLGTPTNATLDPTPGANVGIGTINDDDAEPTVSVNDPSVTEGTGAGTTTLSFTVTLSAASGRTVTVPFTVVDGTATNPADYTVTTVSPLTFNAGVTSQTINLNVVRDATDEANENLTVNLGVPTNATISDGTGIGTINDDDAAPTVSINDVTVTEGTGAGTTTMTFTVSLSAASGLTVTAPFTVVDGSATNPADYTVTTVSPLTFNPGVTTQQISLNIVRDASDEPNENLTVNLGVPTNATILDGTGLGTINDDDGEPLVSINDVAIVEGTGGTTTLTFTATLSGPSGQTVTVPYIAANGTALTGVDYGVITVPPLSFVPGDTSENIQVAIVPDNIDEADETFTITLGTPTNAVVDPTPGLGVGVGTIMDDDAQPVVSINDVTVTEGTGGTNVMNFTVSLTNPSSFSVTMPFTYANGTATAPDYTVVTSSPLVFNSGVTSMQIAVNIVTDDIDEAASETFTVTLGTPTNATLTAVVADRAGVGTINDDDNPPTVSINDMSITEGTGAGTTTLTFTATLSNASGLVITVPFTVAGITANDPADYTVTTASPLSFSAGVLTRTISINIVRDAIDENNETLEVTLGAPTNATLDPTPSNTIGVGTINDDDGAGVTVTVTGGNTTVIESPTPTAAQRDTFSVRLATQPTANVTINLTVSDGQTLIGRVGGPYSTSLNLTFLPSGSPVAPNTLWNVNQTVEVVAVDDALVEAVIHNGAINLAVQAGSAAEYAGLSIAPVAVRIQDNDGPDSLALFNPVSSQASLVNTLQDLPAAGAYNTYAPGAPISGQWVMGDWDGDGQKTPGVYGGGAFYYTNDIGPSVTWTGIWFGVQGPPVAGHFSASVGNDCIGAVASAELPPYGLAFGLYFTCNLTSGPVPTLSFQWLSVVLPDSQGYTGTHQFTSGDWDGNGTDTIAVRRGEFIAYTNIAPAPNTSGYPYSLAQFNLAQYFGNPGLLEGDMLVGQYGNVLAGDWDSNGVDSFGLYYTAGYFYYRNDLLWNSGLYTRQRVSQPIGTLTVATSWRAGATGGGAGQAGTAVVTPAEVSTPVATPTPRRVTTLIESDDARVARAGNWTVQAANAASGGRYVYSSTIDDTLTLEFVGTSLEVIYVEGQMTGTFTIVIDDVAVRTIVTTGSTTVFDASTVINYLTDEPHTLQIVPISGTVAIDAFNVTQEVVE